MNTGNAYRRARNALCFENPHFAVQYNWIILKPKIVKKNPPDSGTGFSQLVPANANRSATWQLRTRQTANKMFISGLV